MKIKKILHYLARLSCARSRIYAGPKEDHDVNLDGKRKKSFERILLANSSLGPLATTLWRLNEPRDQWPLCKHGSTRQPEREVFPQALAQFAPKTNHRKKLRKRQSKILVQSWFVALLSWQLVPQSCVPRTIFSARVVGATNGFVLQVTKVRKLSFASMRAANCFPEAAFCDRRETHALRGDGNAEGSFEHAWAEISTFEL